ncbi:RNA cytidine acetyltransferase [Culicoides brevitarsis]|uniref:RNA cytidine acetyltransferase n=1 Tax=Culicoides brevitarsis TaxID=469753 RepID=UPI00307B189D
MVKKKIDNRIRIMIENGVKSGHRTLFVIVGDKGKNQVPILYDMLSKSVVKQRPTVLWCYKNKDDTISSHGKKRIKKIQSGKVALNEADFFDAFRVSTTIHGRYYKDSHTILGKTYGVCVLQDFEAITPNILARTIETVEGGGLVILLLKTVSSLTSLFSINMDIHNKFKTETHQDVKCRFNERLILSLANCKRCLVVDDQLSILPISSKTANIESENVSNVSTLSFSKDLKILKETLKDTPPAGQLVQLCKTYDQAKALSQFIDTLTTKTLRPPTSLTAARGRGKSAAMGLSLAAAIAFGYGNIFVTSPSPDNLVTLFEFVLKGLDVLEYQEHIDYTITRSINPDFNKAIVKINLTRKNRQTIQYISPTDSHLLNNADLLIIDEAAAIPLPLVKSMLGPYIVFLASTINGYEGTGRSLSLKLISQLQKENNAPEPIKLYESIRYASLDPVESWLTSILCLDDTIPALLNSGCPVPDACELYYIDRDALFSYHKAAEAFLHKFISICVSSHYKNSPNDLQLMCDAPAHHLFCLLGPVTKMDALPEILVVIQVCMEGQFSTKKLEDSMSVAKRNNAGDLIPWNVTEQYGDKNFARLSGVRVVRIATHPNYQRMGYGKRAVKILKDYYKGKFTSLEDNEMTLQPENLVEEKSSENNLLCESVQPRKSIPTLLKRLTERKAEKIDYIGTCFGLTPDLLRFWKSLNFVPVYLSQKSNDLTGEHSCILICSMKKENYNINERENWLAAYFKDFKRRLVRLLGKTFSNFTTGLALSLLEHRSVTLLNESLSTAIIDQTFLPHDIQRLESYCYNQAEYRLILDLTMDLARLVFDSNLINDKVDTLQRAILLGIGLQNKTIDQLSIEFNMPGNQVLAKFYDCIKKLTNYLVKILESNLEKSITKASKLEEPSLSISLHDELKGAAEVLKRKQKKELFKLKNEESNQYFIKGNEDDWKKALVNVKSNIVSVKIGEKRIAENLDKELNKKTRKKMKHQSLQETS